MKAVLGAARPLMATDEIPLSTGLSAVESPRDDISLLSEIANNRDKNAFCELFERYKVQAYNLACNLTRDRTIAEDALQEAMLALWQSATSFNSNDEARGWILGIVAHKSLSAVRTRARSHSREERWRATESYEMNNRDMDNEEVLRALRKHIEKLPAIERQILTLRYTDGLPQEKIGQLLSIPQQTISRRIQKALANLRGSLQSAGFASLLPLVGMRALSEAVNAGHSLPAGLTERIVGNISSAGAAIEATRAMSKGSSPKPAFSGVSVAIVFVVTATLIAGGWAVQSAWKIPPEATTVSQTSRARFERIWNLDTPESLSTLKLTKGSWTYLPNGGVNESGCVESTDDADTEVILDLDGFGTDAYLQITFDWQMMTRTRHYRADVRWTSHDKGYNVLAMKADYSQQLSAWLTNTVFVTPDFTCTYLGQNRVSIRFAKKRPQSPLALELHGGAIRIDNIRITEIDFSQLPAVQEYKEAVEKIEQPRTNETNVVPGVTPFRESKQVGVFFFESSK